MVHGHVKRSVLISLVGHRHLGVTHADIEEFDVRPSFKLLTATWGLAPLSLEPVRGWFLIDLDRMLSNCLGLLVMRGEA